MKILLDENLDLELRHCCPGHEAVTVDYLKWKGTKNGKLLQLAQENGFDALITRDKSLPYQNVIPGTTLRVVILEASPHLDVLRMLMPKALRALESMRPGQVRRIG